MESFIIEGGHQLQGAITPQGAKNEALEVIAAVLLTSDPVRITNIPDILDVNNLIRLLQDMGVKVTRNGKGDFTFQADELNLDFLASDEYVRKCSALRGSVLMMGPLLGRFGKAVVAEPGGDKIGRRRLDTHFLGFKNLGAAFNADDERHVYNIEAEKLHGTYMLLDEASVTGTANIIMAAVLAEGRTTIYNAACEPYIQQLCTMLNAMGAKITGIASNLLYIDGVSELHGTDHRILPDMIEVGSFIGMAAMVGNGIRIKDCAVAQLGVIPDAFRRLGVKIDVDGDDLVIPHQPHYGLLSPGQHPSKLWRCIQFLFRPLTIRFYQRRFIQIFPYIISAALMYKGIRAHAYIYIIKITISHLVFMLLHRQRAGNPLQTRHTRIV